MNKLQEIRQLRAQSAATKAALESLIDGTRKSLSGGGYLQIGQGGDLFRHTPGGPTVFKFPAGELEEVYEYLKHVLGKES